MANKVSKIGAGFKEDLSFFYLKDDKGKLRFKSAYSCEFCRKQFYMDEELNVLGSISSGTIEVAHDCEARLSHEWDIEEGEEVLGFNIY